MSTSINILQYRHNFRALGFALIISGMQVGMYLNLFIKNIGWNTLIFPFALICIANIRNIFRLKFPLMSPTLVCLTVFQAIVWIYILFSPHRSPRISTNFSFVFGFILVCTSLNKSDFEISKIVKYTWIISSVCAVLGLFAKTIGSAEVEGILRNSSLTVDGLTIGHGAVVCLISSLIYVPKKEISCILTRITFIIAIIAIIFAGKRTPLIFSVLVMIIYAVKIKGFNINKILWGAISCGTLIVLMSIILPSQFNILETFTNLYEHTVLGIGDLTTGTRHSGDSAQMRYLAKNWAYNYISQNFTNWNYIVGAGFMTRWLDVPILQSFLDMGIIGLSGYLFFIIIVPIRALLSRTSKNRNNLFACIISLSSAVSTFNSGHPYDLQRWLPVIFLLITIQALRTPLSKSSTSQNHGVIFTPNSNFIN